MAGVETIPPPPVVSYGPILVIPKSATISYPTPAVVPIQIAHKKQ
jgi:hypothetical protein